VFILAGLSAIRFSLETMLSVHLQNSYPKGIPPKYGS
jgi:hypothetical protein